MRAPHVTAHLAQSLDGRLALEGVTTALSTPEGRRSAHRARAEHDAILVGINTVKVDDPQLTVRFADTDAAPIRVVVASRLDVPLDAKVLARTGRVIVVGARGRFAEDARAALVDAGAEVVVVGPCADGMVSLDEALAALAERGVRTLLVEGGGRVLTSFFRERLVHRVEIEIAMVWLGEPSTPVVGALGIGTLAHAPTLANVSVERLGTNLLVRGDVRS